MGGIMGSTPKPPAIPVPPPIAAPATLADSSVVGAAAKTKSGGAAAMAANADNPTGARGLTDKVSTASNTLLGATK